MNLRDQGGVAYRYGDCGYSGPVQPTIKQNSSCLLFLLINIKY
jgi:hypothetical protein